MLGLELIKEERYKSLVDAREVKILMASFNLRSLVNTHQVKIDELKITHDILRSYEIMKKNNKTRR